MKKQLFLLLIAFSFLATSFSLSSCVGRHKQDAVEPAGTVALIFPNDVDETRYMVEQGIIQSYFVMNNYKVLFGVADSCDTKKQAEQIREAITKGAETMVFCSVDCYSQEINTALEEFAASGGKVLCYDRLQFNTTAVHGLVGTTYSTIGELQYDAMRDMPRGSTVEMMAGPQWDNLSVDQFEGFARLAKSKLEDGMWVCPSKNTTFEQTKQGDWGRDNAYTYMKKVLAENYPDHSYPTAIFAANDAQAIGVINALEEHNPQIINYPIITGLNGSQENLDKIDEDKQTMTVLRDFNSYLTETLNIVYTWTKNAPISASLNVNNGVVDVPFVKVMNNKAIYKKDLTE